MSVKCFLVTETPRFRASLRRFTYSSHSTCAAHPTWGHDATSPMIAVIEGVKTADGYWDLDKTEKGHMPPRDDPRWPVKCDACDYLFAPTDHWQLFCDHIYVDADGAEHSRRGPTPGMMWYADWLGESYRGPDGHCLVVTCPGGGEWIIDGPASNCTKREDHGPYGQAHRCWVRHGTPPNITVDKNGLTCAAGAGSIISGSYHGFLRDGEFT